MCVIPLWPIPQAGNFLQFGLKVFPNHIYILFIKD